MSDGSEYFGILRRHENRPVPPWLFLPETGVAEVYIQSSVGRVLAVLHEEKFHRKTPTHRTQHAAIPLCIIADLRSGVSTIAPLSFYDRSHNPKESRAYVIMPEGTVFRGNFRHRK